MFTFPSHSTSYNPKLNHHHHHLSVLRSSWATGYLTSLCADIGVPRGRGECGDRSGVAVCWQCGLCIVGAFLPTFTSSIRRYAGALVMRVTGANNLRARYCYTTVVVRPVVRFCGPIHCIWKEFNDVIAAKFNLEYQTLLRTSEIRKHSVAPCPKILTFL
jgi:hypothetical protein